MNILKFFVIIIMVSLTIFISSCKKDSPIPDFTFTGDNEPAPCEVSFMNSSTIAKSYTWEFGDSLISSEENPKHTYTRGGTFAVKLTATGDGGSNSITKNVIILDPLLSNKDMIIDHNCTKLNSIKSEWIQKAKEDLHIAYGHTSHGSQLTTGMTGLISFKGSTYSWNNGGSNGALDLHDYAMPGDLGAPDRTSWAVSTRQYLSGNADVNVIIWSWCGQVSSATENDIITYLSLMEALEKDFPNVRFVYMTGHLDGTGLQGNLHLRNEQIRNYCKTNKKILFDFADIECYNPDGVYFGDKKPNDACGYDNNNDGIPESNWATEWQNSHIKGTDWFDCSSAHSQPLNANLKAYAAWWLWARLGGWDGNE